MLEFFAKRKARKQFTNYLSPELVQDVLDGRELQTSAIHSGRIEFVFALVRANSPEELANRVGLVADAGLDHEAVVHDLIGPMVVMGFGTLKGVQFSGSRRQLVNQLQQQFGADIKIVHGAVDGHFGSFGNAKRLAFTFTFPGFDRVLAILGQQEFGQVEEFTTLS